MMWKDGISDFEITENYDRSHGKERDIESDAFSSDLRVNAKLPMQGGAGSIPGQGTEVPMLSSIRV